MKKKNRGNIRAAAIIFIVYGILQLIVAATFFATSDSRVYTNSGGEQIPLPGATDYIGQSIPTFVYYGFLLFTGLLGALLIFEGISLHKLKRYSFWPGVILSIVMLIGFPIGTILGLINLYILKSSRAALINSTHLLFAVR